MCIYQPTQSKNYSWPHMCLLDCSSYRTDTGQVLGPSSLSLSTVGHTHGPLQLHTQQCEKGRHSSKTLVFILQRPESSKTTFISIISLYHILPEACCC